MTGELITTFLFWWLLLLGAGVVVALLVQKIIGITKTKPQKGALSSTEQQIADEQPLAAKVLAPVAPALAKDDSAAGPRRYFIGKGVAEPGEEPGSV